MTGFCAAHPGRQVHNPVPGEDACVALTLCCIAFPVAWLLSCFPGVVASVPGAVLVCPRRRARRVPGDTAYQPTCLRQLSAYTPTAEKTCRAGSTQSPIPTGNGESFPGERFNPDSRRSTNTGRDLPNQPPPPVDCLPRQSPGSRTTAFPVTGLLPVPGCQPSPGVSILPVSATDRIPAACDHSCPVPGDMTKLPRQAGLLVAGGYRIPGV